MTTHLFTLDMYQLGDNLLIVGNGSEGEATRVLSPDETKNLFERSATINKQFETYLDFDESALRQFRDQLHSYGEFLFELIFAKDLARLFSAVQGTLGEHDALRVTLRLGSSRLASILWEVMREEHAYIGHKYRFVRYPMIRQRRPESLANSKPLKMLIVAANPCKNLDIERELKALELALANMEDRIQIERIVEPDATFENIDKGLKRCPNFFHFIGHGCFNQEDPESSYLLIDGDGAHHEGKLPLESISATLAICPTSLIFLNACQTAKTSPDGDDDFVSMAYNLVRLGNKCVVAMSHAISDAAAVELSSSFYRGVLKNSSSVDEVLTLCKNDLYCRVAQGKAMPGDWCAPVLYTRAQNLQALKD